MGNAAAPRIPRSKQPRPCVVCEGTGKIEPEKVAKAIKNWLCVDCGNHAGQFYKVRNSVWNAAGVRTGKLCIPCLNRRVQRYLHRPLLLEDFPETVPVNQAIYFGYQLALDDVAGETDVYRQE